MAKFISREIQDVWRDDWIERLISGEDGKHNFLSPEIFKVRPTYVLFEVNN